MLFDSINSDLLSRLLKTDKASTVEAILGENDDKYMTALKALDLINAKALPSKQMSIKTGMISNNAYIPQTSGYANYLYFVSMNNFSGYDNNDNIDSVCLKWECSVDQTNRLVHARQKIYICNGTPDNNWDKSWSDSSTSNRGTNVAGVANYLEIAWN